MDAVFISNSTLILHLSKYKEEGLLYVASHTLTLDHL